ncbi:MAG: SDR family oxidoreductase [Nitrospinaceae bacterium]|jgi:3-oxoacyl-[acyl-carrier protein] reductase|nr:SDR family oxidoreductase [Nitrospinaceae bacterium]MBT3821079.1 SDR family oxidoreductase [Nitrospinaceae bacterium]MBT4095812.1 SDR family oxidoreductase [Nitrospinaceae bacterium]MBT5368667.1 SDR family oxidoreductase [Nitrospinaceae bacterium]MBT5947803.1 SDR family oxidoreductase [Nitrospinaceae bacterium]
MDIRLDGRSALITGGSRGMGRAFALRFAESGADVAIAARRPDMLEETKAEIEKVAKGKVAAYVCDASDAGQIKETFAAVSRDFGKVDILVNNAGTSSAMKFDDITDEMWQADLDLKLFGAIRFCRLAMPPMKERRWGRIINIVTIGGKAPTAERAPTVVTRAAGLALTKVLAGEGAPHNVLVNALCTGQIITDQTRNQHQKMNPDMPFDEYLKERGKKIPLGRMGDAQEYANLACFLASDAASYITGTSVNVDGGVCPVL